MIYRFSVKFSEDEKFLREIMIDSTATFLDLHDAIYASVDYSDAVISSFFTVTDKNEDHEMWLQWNKKQEITQIDMNKNAEEDSYIMETTYLDEFITDERQRLLLMFDIMTERSFYIELKEIIPGENITEPRCSVKKGKAPKQETDLDSFVNADLTTHDLDLGEDFYGSDSFNEDEFDAEGYEMPEE